MNAKHPQLNIRRGALCIPAQALVALPYLWFPFAFIAVPLYVPLLEFRSVV